MNSFPTPEGGHVTEGQNPAQIALQEAYQELSKLRKQVDEQNAVYVEPAIIIQQGYHAFLQKSFFP